MILSIHPRTCEVTFPTGWRLWQTHPSSVPMGHTQTVKHRTGCNAYTFPNLVLEACTISKAFFIMNEVIRYRINGSLCKECSCESIYMKNLIFLHIEKNVLTIISTPDVG